ncbi:assimilatory sulfite reductase [Ephemerocybe angulata]|uniref:Assimilatory sulfite reductase n=1 Tax=Ephemerocybe angulata TaxID=980116 RepID=A0A8H6IDI9_9AGAR|nr:assimilatory sulfite reductase [Tulosesus angulatus]
MPLNASGWSTPLSSSTTLSSPPSPRIDKVEPTPYDNPRIQASQIVEYISSRSATSSFVYVYDVAEQVGFGTLTKEWANAQEAGTAPVVDLQTRAGAGLSLVGRLSQGTSHEAGRGSVLTSYTTPSGLALMAPAFVHLPAANATSRLVVQVPTVTPTGETLSLSSTLSPLASVWSLFPENVSVLLSSTPQQAVDFAKIAYTAIDSHVIHLFDHFSSTREFGHALKEPTTEGATLAEALKHSGYSYFEYSGDAEAQTVLILLNGPLALAAKSVIKNNGISGVAVVTPVIPPTARTIHVVDEVPNALTQGSLYVDIFSTLLGGSLKPTVQAHRVVPSQTQEYLNEEKAFLSFIARIAPAGLASLPILPKDNRSIILFGTPQSPLASIPRVVEDFFLSHPKISSRLLTDFDAFSKQGGIFASRIIVGPKSDAISPVPIPVAIPLDHNASGQSDLLAVLDQNLLKTHSLLKYAKPQSTVLVNTTWTPEEFAANASGEVGSTIQERDLRVFIIDAKDIANGLVGASGPENDAVQNLVLHLAFIRLYLGGKASEGTLLRVVGSSFEDTIFGIPLAKVNAQAWARLHSVALSEVSPSSAVLKNFDVNAIAVDVEGGETVVNGARLGSWHDAAKHLLFPSAYTHPSAESSEEYTQNPALRPEVPDRTFLVTCTVNKRLTPLEYDRNVFHLEFDTSGTGLKYDIGEALGVHGWNDEQEVLDFCEWSTLALSSKPSNNRSTFLASPPNRSSLTSPSTPPTTVDKYALLFIGSPEGSSTFKKLSEKDTVSFAEVLRKYSSARPGIERLCELVGDIKPRHYSIASSQSVVGDRVDLLVVTVDWVTPTGSPRYGQCTRYLSGLKIGQKVTVSIKPSVMKLPPNPKQPLIMAGLGTGAAPFRAFLQHLAWLAEKGSEYLYGEEIEAWIMDGIITRAGLAFSRDGRKKVYIQHKMLEDSEALAKMLYDDEGVFYLCGPTWPVPDVYEALVNALVKYKGVEAKEAGDFLEGLKEEERYVLEVY